MADASCPRPEVIDMDALAASSSASLEDLHITAPTCPFLPLAEIFGDANVSKLTLLKNIGVQSSSFQDELRATAEGRLDAGQVKAANDYFAKTQFISGSDYPDEDDAHYYSMCSNALTLLFNSDSIAKTNAADLRRWFADCNHAFEEMVPNFSCHCVGQTRIGGQVDVRPNAVRVAELAETAMARNKDQKVELSQRQKEKAAKEKAAAAAAAKKKAATSSNATAAASAAPVVAAVKRDKPASLEAARVTLWERLKAMGVTPYKDKDPDFSAARPVGHSTHNLFVKDKKKKQHFLIMGRQNADINLKNVTKAVGMKQLRMSRDAPTMLFSTKGYITALSLIHDTENKCTLIRDTSLWKEKSLRISAGLDPEDERRHIVVDITPAQLDILLQESGHFESIIDLEFPERK